MLRIVCDWWIIPVHRCVTDSFWISLCKLHIWKFFSRHNSIMIKQSWSYFMNKICHPKFLDIIVIVKEWYFWLFFSHSKNDANCVPIGSATKGWMNQELRCFMHYIMHYFWEIRLRRQTFGTWSWATISRSKRNIIWKHLIS